MILLPLRGFLQVLLFNSCPIIEGYKLHSLSHNYHDSRYFYPRKLIQCRHSVLYFPVLSKFSQITVSSGSVSFPTKSINTLGDSSFRPYTLILPKCTLTCFYSTAIFESITLHWNPRVKIMILCNLFAWNKIPIFTLYNKNGNILRRYT